MSAPLSHEQARARFLPRYELLEQWRGFHIPQRFFDTTLKAVVLVLPQVIKYGPKKSLLLVPKKWHGCSKKPWFRAWQGMHYRCGPKNTKRCYSGIKVCADWDDPNVFGAWAEANGHKSGLTIERKNSRGNYCPSNCEWISREENSSRSHVSSPRRQGRDGRFA